MGGDLASSVDYNHQLRHAIVAVGAFVMIAAFMLMLITLGSVVIAATAILLDLLFVAAAYGVMTAVFVHGWGRAWSARIRWERSSPGGPAVALPGTAFNPGPARQP